MTLRCSGSCPTTTSAAFALHTEMSTARARKRRWYRCRQHRRHGRRDAAPQRRSCSPRDGGVERRELVQGRTHAHAPAQRCGVLPCSSGASSPRCWPSRAALVSRSGGPPGASASASSSPPPAVDQPTSPARADQFSFLLLHCLRQQSSEQRFVHLHHSDGRQD